MLGISKASRKEERKESRKREDELGGCQPGQDSGSGHILNIHEIIVVI